MKGIVLLAAIMLACLPAAAGPALAQDNGWQAEYFDNPGLAGAPVLTRVDAEIDFDWELNGPGVGVPADSFSARWTRSDWFDGGTYFFHYWVDDGIRIWVDGELVIDGWSDQQVREEFRDVFIGQGQHRITVEYYEHDGAAAILVDYSYGGPGQGWAGLYYPNMELSGSPVMLQVAGSIDFDWGQSSPGAGVPANGFSVRWTRTALFDGGRYRFFASTDDGVRLWVDDQPVLDAWYDQELPNTHSGDLSLTHGSHRIKVEYYEYGGGAHAHVWWQSLEAVSGWKGEYFDNPRLAGGPVLVRDDAVINFDWGTGGPTSSMSGDAFGARWTRQVTFDPGYYRFSTRSDDGVRVWLDGGLVIDKWQPMEGELHYVDGIFLEGPHRLMVEYFEEHGYAQVRFWISPTGTDDELPLSALTPATSPGGAPAADPPGDVVPADPPPEPSAQPDWWTLRGYRYVLMDPSVGW